MRVTDLRTPGRTFRIICFTLWTLKKLVMLLLLGRSCLQLLYNLAYIKNVNFKVCLCLVCISYLKISFHWCRILTDCLTRFINLLINRTTLFPFKSLKKNNFINSINLKELLFESNNDASVNLSIASKKISHPSIRLNLINIIGSKPSDDVSPVRHFVQQL